MYAEHPHLAAVGQVEASDAAATLDILAALPGEGAKGAFSSPVADFYLTNPIARASRVLAECSSLARGRALEAAE
jgi:NADH-quinone oxidoreductase subunit G